MIRFEILLIVCFTIITNGVNGFLFKKTVHLTEEEAKDKMLAGDGGVAVIDVGLGDMLIVMKEKMYTCRDLQIIGSTVKCPSSYDKFEFKSNKDMCYALRYSVFEELGIRHYCLSPNYEAVELREESGRIACKASTRSLNATIVTEETFYRMCRRRITDPIKVHFFAKDRDTMPAVDSIECSHYTCEFMTYRKTKPFGAIHPGPPPPFIPPGYPGYLPNGYVQNNRYPPVYNDQSANNHNNDNAAAQMDNQAAAASNQAANAAADAPKDDADALKAAQDAASQQNKP